MAGILMGALVAAGCDSDDNDNNGDDGNNNGDAVKTVDTANWIGTACECVGDGCYALDVPLPAPTGNAMIKGCTNVDASAIDGGVKVCLRTISEDYKASAPTTYFPQGYCAISSVGCKGGSICQMAAYGDAAKMDKCPEGSTLIESIFDYSIMGNNVKITNKTCARSCNTDADCNVDGGMTCMTKGKAKFCYNQKNFDGTTNDYTATPF